MTALTVATPLPSHLLRPCPLLLTHGPSSFTQAPCDVAFVLNVLDRCKEPELLLKQARAA